MAPLEESPSGLSSHSSSGLGEKVGLRLSFGGDWQPQKDGSMKYVGGETYLEKVPSNMRYADLMHRMSEKVNGAVTLKYCPPGEEVDVNNLVTCVDDDHVQEMFEEYFKAAKANDTPGKTFRLKMWLFEAKEEELTPEDINKASRGRRTGTPRDGDMTRRSSSSGSNNSSASAGTRSPHFQGKKLGYSTSNMSRPLNDVEMQEKEAEEMAEEMNADEEEIAYNERNWHAYATNNLHRAINKTFDSCGWPHDRSPFLKAKQQRHSDAANRDLKGGWAVGGGGRALGMDFDKEQPAGEGYGGFVNDPMESGTPDANSAGPRMYTQDSYKEDADGDADVVPKLPSPAALLSNQIQRRAAAPQSIHLPSQLGSDVGNAFTTDTAEEKVDMEVIVNGVADRVLGEGPLEAGYSVPQNLLQDQTNGLAESAWPVSPYTLPRNLSRNLSGFASDSVFRIPQSEIRVLQVIGEGTFGEVVLAYNSVFGRVAVKWLKPAKMDKHRLKFWEEARMLAALNHPNVLRFYGVVTKEVGDQTVVGIMTEFMPGSSLSNYLRSGSGGLSLLQRAELARGAVNGLAYLHQMNIVHFDLKPDNLLLDNLLLPNHPSPGVKVADFGLSKQKFHKYVSGVRDLRGTLPYMAPELVHDPDHVSESADIWSLGIVFWEMLTLETPFQYLSPQGIMTGHMMGKLRPEIPDYCEVEWQELLNGCLQQNPSDRWTLAHIAQWLDQILDAQYNLQHTSMYSS